MVTLVPPATATHWRLVGPWYRWATPGLPSAGRGAGPAIQKLAGADFMTQFLAKPQHSLKYDPVVDVVQTHDLVAAGTVGKLAALFALDAKGDPLDLAKMASKDPVYRARLAPGTLRKLYQPTHDRHYLVTCELHCDDPGFPRVARDKVCQAGFVVRRRRSVVPKSVGAKDVEAHASIVRKSEADLDEMRLLQATAEDGSLDEKLRKNAMKQMDDLAKAAGMASWTELVSVRKKELALERKAFDDWRRSVGVSVAIEGWFPSADGGPTPAQRGRWLELKGDAAQTADVTSGEQVYPLLALVPDPRDAAHDAAGRTLYFGVVPTQDLQHDDRGDPHFDDRSTFELRCFVRAHHDCPPKRGKRPDCGGALAWSRPSEAFRVAAPFDLIGTSNRPVTIKMPDLRDLAAQAATRPRGKFSPVRFVQPQHMSPGGMGGFSICSFSIPLITIVALFVLNLFLPIVVFLFQLWFLLVFRFCIPPQVKMDAGVDAALAVTPPGVDLAIDGAVSIDNLPVDADDLQALLATSVDKGLAMDKAAVAASGYDLPSVDLSKQSSNSLGPIDQSFTDAASLEDDDPPPDVGEPLAYEDPVVSVRPVARNGA